MIQEESSQFNKEALIKIFEYSKYLYEEEKSRTERIEKKVNIFTMFLGGSFLGILTFLSPEKLVKSFNGSIIEKQIVITIFVTYYASFLLFLCSAVFIILVYKVLDFEWLCNPEKRISKLAENEEHVVLDTIIADFVVTANRNHELNDKKAKWLAKAIFFLLIGLILWAVSLVTFNGLVILKGGY